MAEVGATGSDYKLSATLEMRDQMTGKLRSAVSQLKSVDGAVSKLGNNSAITKLQNQLDSLNNLRKQVNQFKEMKKEVAATKKAYEESNAATAKLARQYKAGQSAVSQLQAKHAELKSTFEASKSATSQLQNKLGGLKAEAAKFKSSGAVEEYKKLQSQIKATSAELKASQAMTRQTGSELKSLAGGIKQAQLELGNIGTAFERSKSQAKKFKQELNSKQIGLSQMRQGLAARGFNTRDFAASDRKLREQIRNTQTSLRQEQLRETLRASGMGLNSQSVRVNVNGNATSTLGKIKNQLNSLTQKTWNVAVNAKNKVGGKISELTNGAAMGLGTQVLGTAGIGYGVVDAVNTYKDFEYQMATVRAITGADDTEFETLTKRAKELGATTMFKASEVGKAEEYMAMAGWKTPQIDKGLPAVLNLAAASGEELARVSDIVTDSMTAFGLKATDVVKTTDGKIVPAADHFSDIMAALATNANTTVGMAGETSKYSAAVVGSLYASQSTDDKMNAVSDWAMLTGIMANAGIKASMSGTAQRSMLTRLAALQQNANAARKSLGVDFVYQNDEYNEQGELIHKAGQTRRLRDVVGDIRNRFQGDFNPDHLLDMTERLGGKEFTKQQRIKLSKMIEDVKAKGGMSDSDKATLTSMMSGQEGMAAWLSVLMASTDDWEKMADAIDKAHGKAEEMSKIKMDTLQGDVQTLGSAFEALQLEMFEGSGGSGLRSFVQGLTDDIRVVQKALKDGFQIGDIGSIISKVATQLKDKFLEFDGVGSILAGGALVMGLKKVYDWTLKLKDAAMSMKNWYRGTSTITPPTTRQGGITQSVGSMVIHANSVVVNGRAVSGGTNTTATTNRTSTNTTSTTTATRPATTSRLGSAAKGGAFAGAITAAFAVMDNISVRNDNKSRVEEAQSAVNEAKEEHNQRQAVYNEIATDSERKGELPQAAQLLKQSEEELQQATLNLKVIQKEAVKNNNASLLGGVGAVGGAMAGAAAGTAIAGPIGTVLGLALGGLFASAGSNIGKEVGEKFDYDILGWLKGENSNKSAFENSVPAADWKTHSGKMYSELSARERIEYQQNETAEDKANRQNAQTQHNNAVAQAKREEFETESAKKQVEVYNRHRQDSSKEEIEKQTAKFVAEDAERKNIKQFGGTSLGLDGNKNFKAANENAKFANETQKSGRDAFWKNLSDFFTSRGEKTKSEMRPTIEKFQEDAKNYQNQPTSAFGINPITGQTVMPITPTTSSISENQPKPAFETNPITGQNVMPSFNISDLLPDFNLSEWIAEKTAGIDLASILPDFSGIGEIIGEQLNIIPTKMSEMASLAGESFSQIPSLASEAFSNLATFAEEGFSQIQTKWNELPNFFSGIFQGLGGIASSAGTAIASGINSGIGMIKSAWESLSGWLSSKISSLSSMASNAINSITGGGVGHNATGTNTWRGGWTEINEQGGEIIYLPSGTKIYPHATTMKMLQSEMKAGNFDNLLPTDELGNIKGYSGMADNLVQTGDLSPVREAKLQKQREEMLSLSGATNNLKTSAVNLFKPITKTFEYDELGNIKGYSGMADNLVQAGDLSPVREAKLQKQREEMFQPSELSAFPQAFDVGSLSQGITNNSNSTTNNNNGLTVTGNTFTINKGSDIDEIFFRMFQMMSDAQANNAGI